MTLKPPKQVQSPEIDISDSVSVTPLGDNKFKWTKVPNATSGWTFDLITEDYATEKVSLTGWYTTTSGKYYWDASYTGKIEQTAELASIKSHIAPSDEKNLKDDHGNLHGVDGLASLTPVQATTLTAGRPAGHPLLAGEDGAQARGDEIMVRVCGIRSETAQKTNH